MNPNPSKPAPSKESVVGSGTLLVVPPSAATLPVFPLFPTMSEAKKNPPPLAIKLAIVTPVAEPTLNDRGPVGPLLPVQGEHFTDKRKLPKVEAVSGAGPTANPDVIEATLMTPPTTLNSKASPAPVPAKFSLAARVNTTDT